MQSKYFRTRQFRSLAKTEKGRIYLFCGFGSPLALYAPAILRLRRHGFKVIGFRFQTKAVLGLSIQTLPDIIHDVSDTVRQLEVANKKPGPAVVIGNSMGSVFAWHTASRVPSVSKVVANTGYALISRHIFEDKIGQSWRKTLVAQGIDEKMFHEQIVSYEPISVFNKLKGKQVMLFLNKDDNVISFSNSLLLKRALRENNIAYTYVENSNMRHGTAIFKNLMSKRLIEFLKT